MSREIIIKSPKISDYDPKYRDYSHWSGELSHLDRMFTYGNITPENHPQACDLFAGDGVIGNWLENRGWQSQNIACFDIAVSPTPLTGKKIKWFYWDLYELSCTLYSRGSFPQEVSLHKNIYDLVFSFSGGEVSEPANDRIVNYFLKPGGMKFLR